MEENKPRIGRRPGSVFPHLRKFADPLDHARHRAFLQQKAQCNFRKEGWEFTIEEYFEIWHEHVWAQRGKKNDSLVMTRVDIEKPWSLDNCVLVLRYQLLCRGKKMRKLHLGQKDLNL
jgi:hypothetical protein